MHLMQYYHHQGALGQSLAYGQRILEREPWREEVHRTLIQLYLAQGYRAQALRQYELCRRVLRKELGVEPMAETQALAAQAAAPVGAAAVPALGLQHVLEQLRQVAHHLTSAQTQLAQVQDLVVRLASHQERE